MEKCEGVAQPRWLSAGLFVGRALTQALPQMTSLFQFAATRDGSDRLQYLRFTDSAADELLIIDESSLVLSSNALIMCTTFATPFDQSSSTFFATRNTSSMVVMPLRTFDIPSL